MYAARHNNVFNMNLSTGDGASCPRDDYWSRIQQNDPIITNLEVSADTVSPNVAVADIRALGLAIGNSTHLRKLKLSLINVDEMEKFQVLCEGINENRSIKELCSSSGIFQWLTPFLENNENLTCINVDREVFFHERTSLIAAPLMRRRSPLDELHFNWKSHCGGESLVVAFRENPALTPKKLSLEGYLGQTGCIFIGMLLQDPRCTLEELYLDVDREAMNDDIALMLANALSLNKSLKTLHFRRFTISNNGIVALSRCLCNKTSINATFSSNHTIQGIGMNTTTQSVHRYLLMNRNEDKKAVARRKVLLHHFSARNFSMRSFVETDFALLILVVNYIDKGHAEYNRERYDIARWSIIYNMLTRDPAMCAGIP